MKSPRTAGLNVHPTALALAGLILSLGSAELSAQVFFMNLPDVNLFPNTPGQTFNVSIENDTGSGIQVTGIGFNLQVADGGTAAGGSINGPAITSVDIFSGTAFASNNNGLSGSGQIVPQVYQIGTLTHAGTVTIPNGVSEVAAVTIDTTGFFSGTFGLTLDTHNGPTKYTTTGSDLFPALEDGKVTLALVPEPHQFVGATAIALLGSLVWRRVSLSRASSWEHRVS